MVPVAPYTANCALLQRGNVLKTTQMSRRTSHVSTLHYIMCQMVLNTWLDKQVDQMTQIRRHDSVVAGLFPSVSNSLCMSFF